MPNDDQSMSGATWKRATINAQNQRHAHKLSVEEVDESEQFNLHTDFGYKEETSSGFEKDLHRQSTFDAGHSNSSKNHWKRKSKNIDDIPIPTVEGGIKTFEELLAEKMEAEEALRREDQVAKN